MSSREQFEKWYRAEEIDESAFLQRDAAGNYSLVAVQKLWLTWQASRKAVVVELPPRADTGEDLGGWPNDWGAERQNKIIDRIWTSLRHAGLGVSFKQ